MKCPETAMAMTSSRLLRDDEGRGTRSHYVAVDFLPLLVLPAIAVMWRPVVAPWMFMWAMAFGIFAGCKWLTWRRAAGARRGWNDVAYLLAWPGLDANEFLANGREPRKLSAAAWCGAALKTAFGICVLWGAARLTPSSQPLVQGWLGLIGLIFVLHFGTFHLLALMWQALGVNARPLMKAPIASSSLSDFWSNRWNSAFNKLAHDVVFRPLHRQLGVNASTMAVFLASGLVHEMVISLPAGGGYGLPTAYFTIQGMGILAERSEFGRKLGLGHGGAGRAFAVLVTAVPAFWLFHPVFVTRVIIPFMHAIGAL